jgi:ADP-ribosyl-[dinitrogen reductase] hydrolase
VTTFEERRDRARGLLVGLAIGDALGAPVEFEAPASIEGRRWELFSFPGGGPFGWAPGEFTDDTQMALVLARHLRDRSGNIEPDALASEFSAWAHDAADVGSQTWLVLSAVARGVDWRQAVRRLSDDAAGNGALMRVAPVAIPAHSAGRAAELGRQQSQVTHPNGTCLESCAVLSLALSELLEGSLPELEKLAEHCSTEEVRRAIVGAAAARSPGMSGWTVATLQSALWATLGAGSFEEAVWRAVSLGRDADTVGAVAGSLAGARWGLASIPEEMAAHLQSRHPMFRDEYPDALIALADALLDARQGSRQLGSVPN